MTVTELYNLYNPIRLTISLYNEAFGKVLIPLLKLTLGSFTVASIYSTITLFTATGATVGVLMLFFFSLFSILMQLFLYPRAAKIGELSRTICSVSHKNLSKYEAALQRAFFPVGITSGSFYIISSTTPLTFLNIIVGYTIGFLMI